MKKINLINPSKSEVKLEITTFPDGEPHLKFLEELDRKDTYVIYSRITNPNELFILMQCGDILKRQGVEFELNISYLMSQRMDRVVNFEESFTLKLVADAINEIGACKVRIFEPHSERSLHLINNSIPYPNIELSDNIISTGHANIAICYPDHGAYDRYSMLYDNGIYSYIRLNKKRDLKNYGQIVSIDIEDICMLNNILEPDYIVVIDDLCDGGGTFAWSAKVLKERFPNAKLGIFVKHAVNPKGIKVMSENYDNVFITDSYRDWDISEFNNVKVINVVD